MSVTVRVPTTLRTLTAGASEIAVEGTTVGQVLMVERSEGATTITRGPVVAGWSTSRGSLR